MSNNFNDGSVLKNISSLIDEINADHVVKHAAQKKADEAGGSGSAKKDPGGYKGQSTHPSAKADGNLHAAPVGARAAENERDVKKDVPVNVEETGAIHADSDNDQIQLGTKKAPTGEDPASERDFKGDKDDAGTSHPANAEEIGEKYSSLNFPQLYKMACARSNALLSRLASGETYQKEAGTKPAQPTQHATQPVEQGWSKEAEQAVRAGYELSQLAAAFGTSPDDESLLKFAAAEEVVRNVITEGQEEADWVGEYLYKAAAYEREYQKHANDPTGGAMEGGAGQEALLPPGAGPGGPGGALPPELGGDPGAGGAPAGPGPEIPGGPGGPGGGGDQEEVVNEMANALLDSGIPPDLLIQAIQQAAAGGGAGGPGGPGPGGEGAEPGATPGGGEKAGSQYLGHDALQSLYKVAHQVKNHMASGRFRLTAPTNKTAQHERNEAVEYLSYVKEVLGIRR